MGNAGRAWVAEYALLGRPDHGVVRAPRPHPRVLAAAADAARRVLPQTFPAVNAGIRRAAARARRTVRVIDLVDVFTPGGRYRDTMPVGGRERRVRQADGVHLNTTERPSRRP